MVDESKEMWTNYLEERKGLKREKSQVEYSMLEKSVGEREWEEKVVE